MKVMHDDKLIHREPFTQFRFYRQKPLHRATLTRNIYKRKHLHTPKLLHQEALTERNLLHRAAFTQQSSDVDRNIYTQSRLHREESNKGALSQNRNPTSFFDFRP